MTARKTAKPVCFYLPQFHRVPQNDRWWGEGFTEWTLVQGAKPLFGGHAQPVAPHADVGYYDLMDRDVRRRQAEMARAHGIHGFCYYHYWFGGTRLLHAPLERMLEDGEPDLPFCLCWANEPWSRRWSGEERDVLQPQVYGGREDWQAHFDTLCRYFDHPNYIRVDDHPVFLIYRIGHVTDAADMVNCWRELAARRGDAGLHVVAVEGAFSDNREAPEFVDAVAEHHPSCVQHAARPLVAGGLNIVPAEELWRLSLSRTPGGPVRYRGACHAWDNTPRRGRDGYVILPSRPERYTQHLREVFDLAESSGHEPLVFLNAWNEWSEGAHLEPGAADGYRWLRCVHDALNGQGVGEPLPPVPSLPVAAPPGGDWLPPHRALDPDPDLVNAFVMHGARGRSMIALGCAEGETAERLGLFAGAARVVGFETSEARAARARARLDAVLVIDPEQFGWSGLGDFGADLLVCNTLLGRLRDPRGVLEAIRSALAPGANAWFGFDHAGHHTRLRALLGDAPVAALVDGRHFSVDEATALVRAAGYSVEKVYRVYGPRPAGMKRPRARDNAVSIGGVRLAGLTGEQVDRLFCIRFFIVARPVEAGAPALTRPPGVSRYASLLRDMDRTVAPHDSLYGVYAREGNVEHYFASAARQVEQLDALLAAHCRKTLAGIDSIADYACHYGRLLRALRAARPDARLYAYDIDPDAVEFCVRRFHCIGRVAGWKADVPGDVGRHELLVAASLLTHTGLDFFHRVLALWRALLAPGGLLCFTYLGRDYLERWRDGELAHYGPVESSVREARIADFQREGHAFAGFGTFYSDADEYGVGFLDESVVRAAIARHDDLEYLGSLRGDDNPFNQDLAVVRRAGGGG